MRYLFFVLVLGLVLASCQNDNIDVPDVREIDGSFDLYRTEQDLMKLDSNRISLALNELTTKYPAFMGFYMNNVMGFTSPDNPQLESENIKGFIQDENINLLYQAVQIQYGDFNDLHKDFEEAFQFYKYYFPERNVPDIYTFISEYGIQRFIFPDEEGDDALAIGLDLFLGGDYPYQEFIPNNPAFSQYLIRRFNKEHLVKRAVGALVEDIIGPNKGNILLDKMIHNGKKLYILDHLLPYTPDSIIMEYTEAQLDWCQNNELQMWAYLLKEDLFYESDINKINKLVNPAPSYPGMPKEAPGRTGNYLGWKIVEAYMERNPELSIQDLVAFTDAQKILEKSKFKPRK